MNYKSFNLGDWIEHISGVIEDESELDGNEMRDLVKFLSGLPNWIPVSERLPEVDGNYLATVKGIGSNHNEIYSFANSLYKIDKYAFSGKKEHGWYFYDSEYGYIDEPDVIAWMPLPEPYEEGAG